MPNATGRPKWPGTLTDRQRFNRQMHCQPVDRCFNREFGLRGENFRTWPVFLQNAIRLAALVSTRYKGLRRCSCAPGPGPV